MARYKPYEKYKDSGVEWIGEVPEHWSLSQVNKHFDICLGKMLQPEKQIETDTLEKYLCSVNIDSSGINLDVVKEMWFSSVERTKYEIVQGDLLVCEGGDVGKVALWDGSIYPCYIQNALHRLRPLRDNYNKFLMYWFIFLKTVGYIDMVCNKATMAHFTREKVARTVFIVLPLREQQAIANFLNQKTSEVDGLIADKEKLVSRLQEYRQSIISEAVTKGLNPDVKMKDSGFEWIGEIPENWEISRISRHFDVCLGKMLQPIKQTDTDTMEKYLCSINLNSISIVLDMVKEMWFSSKDREKYEIMAGDLLVCEGGDVGKVAIWDGSIEPCYIQNALHRIRPIGNNRNQFLKYWFYYIKAIGYIEMICNKATMAHYTREKVCQSYLLYMSPSEQQAIADYLDQKTAEIDDLISGIQESIDQLKSYRQSLISEAVTGKIDVRGVI